MTRLELLILENGSVTNLEIQLVWSQFNGSG